jgi:acyl carrier protein
MQYDGMWGRRSLVESRLRRLAADQLGVEEDALRPELSLVQDLAADSLDLAELAVAIEEDIGIAVPDAILEEVHTWADLVGLVHALVDARLEADARRAAPPARIVARITPGGGARPFDRAGLLTPYLAEVLADDMRRHGADARLDVTVAHPADDGDVARVRAQLAAVAAHGVEVRVQREPLPGGRRQPSAA